MIHLMRVVDRALGYVFVASTTTSSTEDSEAIPDRDLGQRLVKKSPESATVPKEGRTSTPNTQALFSSALSSIPDAPHVGDIQERWIDHKEVWDEWETGEWRREGAAAAQRKTETR